MKARVVILGGGISGLTSAWSLARSSSRHEVVLLESSHRLGGWINSERTANNGAVHELGPRSMRVAGNAGKTALAMVIITSTNYYYYYYSRSKIRVIPLTYIKLRSPSFYRCRTWVWIHRLFQSKEVTKQLRDVSYTLTNTN